MSCEMNTMTMTMPVMPHGPVQVQVRCFEGTADNIATLRTLAKTAAADGSSISVGALTKAGMKAQELTVSLSTKVKTIRSEVAHRGSTAPVGEDDVHLNMFAVAHTTSGATTADPLISLVDEVTVEELLTCPQIYVQRSSDANEVCVGDANADAYTSSSSSSSGPTLILFYARDTTLGCSSGCCLCACLAACCAAVFCCCCTD